MSITLDGTLAVQRISGVNGDFSVGKLETEIGIFSIKDPHLDQFDTGKYAGRFIIDSIFPRGYMSRNNIFIVEIRAVVKEYIIHTDEPDELDADVGLTEEDPLDTAPSKSVEAAVPATPQPPVALPLDNPASHATQSKHPVSVTPETAKPVSTQAKESSEQTPENTLESLFGELWPLGETVTLDPTTIRSDPVNHRKRTEYLKSQGYTFKASSQSWVKQNSNKSEVTVL